MTHNIWLDITASMERAEKEAGMHWICQPHQEKRSKFIRGTGIALDFKPSGQRLGQCWVLHAQLPLNACLITTTTKTVWLRAKVCHTSRDLQLFLWATARSHSWEGELADTLLHLSFAQFCLSFSSPLLSSSICLNPEFSKVTRYCGNICPPPQIYCSLANGAGNISPPCTHKTHMHTLKRPLARLRAHLAVPGLRNISVSPNRLMHDGTGPPLPFHPVS